MQDSEIGSAKSFIYLAQQINLMAYEVGKSYAMSGFKL